MERDFMRPSFRFALAAPLPSPQHGRLLSVVDNLVAVFALVVGLCSRLCLVCIMWPLDLPKLQHLHIAAVRTWDKIPILYIRTEPPLPDVARLECRRAHLDNLLVVKGLRSLRRQLQRPGFRPRPARKFIDLVKKDVAGRTTRQIGCAVGADECDIHAPKCQFQVFALALQKLVFERRRQLEERLQAFLTREFRQLFGRVADEHGAGVLRDSIADHVLFGRCLAELRPCAKCDVMHVRQCPGAALSNSDRILYLSAHSDTVSRSGGLSVANASMIHAG